ncbi:MAG: MobV family relaxase [Cyanobacteria bacterium J06555_3]
MAHAIARIAKLKSGNVVASGLHTGRRRLPLNANPEVKNVRFIGQLDSPDLPSLETIVRDRIGDQTIRKNGVLCVEMLLTASPEYFRPDDPSRAGYYEPERLADFQQSVHSWLNDEYGDRIVRAELHLDESTPHIHAYLVPLDERGKLNCRGIFGGRQKLSQFQDSFANAMSPLGLERGIKGSKAKHTKIQHYYAAINADPDRSLDKSSIEHQLADRQQAIKDKKQALITAKLLARDKEELEQRLNKAEVKLKAQSREITNLRKQNAQQADKVRDLPLHDVAYELGLEPDPKDKHKWQSADHTITITGSKFYDWKQMHGSGGAIDLVMHINEYDYKQSVTWLSDRFGEGATIEAVTYKAKEIIQHEQVPEFTPPLPDFDKWLSVRKYLTRTRLLPSGLVDLLHEQGLVYADQNQNAVFIRRALEGQKITGASLRGTVGEDNKFKGLAKGSKRSQGWFHFDKGEQSGDPVRRVVLVESPIDAMSLSVLERTNSKKTLYLSTDGAGQIPLKYLQEIKDIVIAFDRDLAGAEMAQRIKTQLPQAVVKSPKTVDWNQDLINSFDWSSQKQSKEIDRDRGGLSL